MRWRLGCPRSLIRDVNARISPTPLSFLLGVGVAQRFGARAAMATLDAFILRIIRERGGRTHKNAHGRPALHAARGPGRGHGRGHERRAASRRRSVTIFLAGHETTANALAWALYLLARHPDAYRRLRTEATTVLGGRTPTASDLPRLGFALQVFKESLRLYPPAYLTSRLAMRDVEIGGHRISAGTDVIANICTMQRRPEYFPDPDRFDPDRFEAAAEKAIPAWAYIPFGAGARVCIGNNFALMEGQLILATLAQRVEHAARRQPGEIAPEPLVTLRPASACLRVKPIALNRGDCGETAPGPLASPRETRSRRAGRPPRRAQTPHAAHPGVGHGPVHGNGRVPHSKPRMAVLRDVVLRAAEPADEEQREAVA